jgi:predicted  nucleic acid-binding Zn-ribbon protein
MDFHTFASAETSALLEQLLARQASAPLHQLRAVRDALDAAARALEDAPSAHDDVRELAARLTGAAEAEIGRARDEAQAAVDAARDEIRHLQEDSDRLRAAMAQSDADAAALRTERQAASDRAESAERDLGLTIEAHAAVETALHALEAELRAASQDKAAIESQLHEARAAIERLLAEAEELKARIERDAAEKVAFQTQLAAARETGDERDLYASELAATTARLQGLEGELAAAREGHERASAAAADEGRERAGAAAAELDAVRARLQALEQSDAHQKEHIHQLESLLDEAAQTEKQLRAEAAGSPVPAAVGAGNPEEAEILRGEVDRMVSLFDASGRAVAEMANCATSGALLTELVKRLSIQFTRVAFFRLKGNRLEGEHQVGFDDATEMSKLVIPTTVDSMLTRAVASGAVQSLMGKDVAIRSGTPFGGTPMSAVVLPIVVHGTTLGVVYADDSDVPDSARGPAVHESSVGFARLLVGQVVVLLVRHAHELKALAELRQYAATLLLEAREMYLADAQAGKSTELLRTRLKDNIDCASQLYTYRAAMEGTAAAALLDEQILAAIEEATPFARDLAAVVAQMTSANVQLTAEAS